MKKFLAIMLVLCLVLCGCEAGGNTPNKPNAPGQSGGEHSTNPTQPGGETMEVTRPAEVEMVDYDAQALTVTISINPEFALGLTHGNEILSVEALNADAEKLLAGLDLVGKFYDQGIKHILTEAENQGFLNQGAEVTFSVQENAPGAVTMATLDILTIPVKDYREDIRVDLEYDAKNPVIDFDKLKVDRTESNSGPYWFDNYTVTLYKDILGYHRMSDFVYEDGTHRVIYFDGDERIVTTRYADGSSDYEHYVGDDCTGYFLDTDGNRTTFVTVGNWSQTIGYDGSITEMFYEGKQANRQLVRSVTTYSDGSTQECFYENGTLVSEVWKNADGTISDDSIPAGPVSTEPSSGTNSDGSTYEYTFHPNGNFKTANTTWPNGDYINQTYYENGNIETNIEFREGRYSELSYDENGQLVLLFQRDPDGKEYDEVYENGNRKTSYITWPNGDYRNETFYESGMAASIVAFTNGDYWENYFDEKGMLTSYVRRNADSTESYGEQTFYENGNVKTYTEFREGIYVKQQYDENGMLTSLFQRDPDGTEYDWDYKNGEPVGYTVTYPDGSSEYHSYG